MERIYWDRMRDALVLLILLEFWAVPLPSSLSFYSLCLPWMEVKKDVCSTEAVSPISRGLSMAHQGLGEAHPDTTKPWLLGPSLSKRWPNAWPLMNVATCRAGRLPRTPGESRWPRPLGRKASFLTSHPNPSSNLPLSSSLLPPQLPSLSPTHLSRVLEQREGSLRSI